MTAFLIASAVIAADHATTIGDLFGWSVIAVGAVAIVSLGVFVVIAAGEFRH